VQCRLDAMASIRATGTERARLCYRPRAGVATARGGAAGARAEGGGARGLAHVGVLQRLEESGYDPAIAGLSPVA
jgi:predicted acylesterase/phospholipase RssA